MAGLLNNERLAHIRDFVIGFIGCLAINYFLVTVINAEVNSNVSQVSVLGAGFRFIGLIFLNILGLGALFRSLPIMALGGFAALVISFFAIIGVLVIRLI